MTHKIDFNHKASDASKDEWLTPPYIIHALGEFDLDPCAPPLDSRPWPTAKHHISLPDDGRALPWHGRIWLNPPYGKETFLWMAKLAAHRSGVALIFARTETKGFHREIWEKAHGMFFFEGRLAFYHVDGTKGAGANAPSCLVSYSPEDTAAIHHARVTGKIKGRLVTL